MKTIMCFILFACLLFSGCYHRFRCDSSNDVKLGETDYSQELKLWENEYSQDSIILSNSLKTYVLLKKSKPKAEPRRLLEYTICESIDIKPYKAHAYYEYKNLSSIFGTDSMVLSIEPEILYENKKRVEVLYIGFDKAKSGGGVKARIPISNVSAITSQEPFGALFKLHKTIELNGQTFNNVWLHKQNGQGIYYSKTKGLIAIEVGNSIFVREK